MTELELLKRARTLLDDESKWVQGVMSINRDGLHVWPTHPDCGRRCIQGALYAAYGHSPHSFFGAVVPEKIQHVEQRLNAIIRSFGEDWDASYVAWQDDDARVHGEVLQLLDDAIAELECKPAFPLPPLPGDFLRETSHETDGTQPQGRAHALSHEKSTS